jgi:hypothetical protein
MSKLSFQNAKGKKVVVEGYQYAKAGPETKTYKSSIKSKLPNKVDLRPFLIPVENQGQVGVCTANAAQEEFLAFIEDGEHEAFREGEEGEVDDEEIEEMPEELDAEFEEEEQEGEVDAEEIEEMPEELDAEFEEQEEEEDK